MRGIFQKIRKTVTDYFGHNKYGPQPKSSHNNSNSQPNADVTGTANPMKPPRQEITHSVKEVFQVSQMDNSGHVETSTEEHSREGATLQTKRTQTKILTGSGELVEAQQLKARCQDCGAYESELFRCSTCGIALCRKCAIETDQPGIGLTILCQKHYNELVQQDWNYWLAKDHWGEKPGCYGYKPRPPKAPR